MSLAIAPAQPQGMQGEEHNLVELRRARSLGRQGGSNLWIDTGEKKAAELSWTRTLSH